MLWIFEHKSFGLNPIIVANSRNEAMIRIVRITGIVAGWTVERFEATTLELQDMAIEAVSMWFGNYCDYADGNDCVTDAEFDEVKGWMDSTYDVVFKGCNI